MSCRCPSERPQRPLTEAELARVRDMAIEHSLFGRLLADYDRERARREAAEAELERLQAGGAP